jgi:hypothetical protein
MLSIVVDAELELRLTCEDVLEEGNDGAALALARALVAAGLLTTERAEDVLDGLEHALALRQRRMFQRATIAPRTTGPPRPPQFRCWVAGPRGRSFGIDRMAIEEDTGRIVLIGTVPEQADLVVTTPTERLSIHVVWEPDGSRWRPGRCTFFGGPSHPLPSELGLEVGGREASFEEAPRPAWGTGHLGSLSPVKAAQATLEHETHPPSDELLAVVDRCLGLFPRPRREEDETRVMWATRAGLFRQGPTAASALVCATAPLVRGRWITLVMVRRQDDGVASAEVLMRRPGSPLTWPVFATVDATGAWRSAVTRGSGSNGEEWRGSILFPARGTRPLRLVALVERRLVWFELPSEVFGG